MSEDETKEWPAAHVGALPDIDFDEGPRFNPAEDLKVHTAECEIWEDGECTCYDDFVGGP